MSFTVSLGSYPTVSSVTAFDVEITAGTFCLTATFNPQVITFPDVDFGLDLTKSLVLPTFTHDIGDTYSDQSACGPINIVLTPVVSFLTYNSGLNTVAYAKQDA